MGKRFWGGLGFLLFTLFSLVPASIAQHGHGGGSKEESSKMETKEVLVEGMKIAFMIMTNEEHQKMLKEMKIKETIEPGTTHIISVTMKDEKTDKEITEAKVSMKVTDPKNKDQIKTLKYMEKLKSYDGYFNLSEKGKYQILVLVRMGNQKRTAGISYEIK
ncbi:MAG: hypothetical protein ACPL5I_02470 [Thermodesulfobacteriota bacterium]